MMPCERKRRLSGKFSPRYEISTTPLRSTLLSRAVMAERSSVNSSSCCRSKVAATHRQQRSNSVAHHRGWERHHLCRPPPETDRTVSPSPRRGRQALVAPHSATLSARRPTMMTMMQDGSRRMSRAQPEQALPRSDRLVHLRWWQLLETRFSIRHWCPSAGAAWGRTCRSAFSILPRRRR
jgi:hypothetical protein